MSAVALVGAGVRRTVLLRLLVASSGALPAFSQAAEPGSEERSTRGSVDARPARSEPLLRLAGLVHTDWVVHRQSSEDEIDPARGEPLNRDRFLLRRARLQLDLEHGLAFGRGSIELNGLSSLEVRPFEAYLGARWSDGAERSTQTTLGRGASSANGAAGAELSVSMGLMQIPFGFDAVEPPDQRPVLERTHMVRALFPGQRDIGFSVDAAYHVFRASLALMNGAPIGESGFAGVELDAAKDWLGRVGVDVPVAQRVSVQAGVSGLSGRGLHRGTASTKDILAWNDGNEDGFVELSELSVIPGAPATASAGYSRFALGADARLRVDLPVLGELVLRAEVIRAKDLDRGIEIADPIAAGRSLRELGWALGASLELTRFAQVAVQYDTYRPDADARRQSGAALVPFDPAYGTLAVALSGRFPPLRVIAEYDHNDNDLGRADDGSPARLADDAFTLRGELYF